MAENESKKNAAKFPQQRSTAEHILSKAQDSRAVVQDFVPLAQSLEWELGQQYFKDRGNKAFISDTLPIPFVVNNDGNLSRHAADIFFANLADADKAGALEADIYALELGIGVGLYARFFLDRFQALCRKHNRDYYDRLIYIAGDKSERMLMDVIRHGVLANHPGRYRLRPVDALCPEKDLLRDVAFQPHPRRSQPFRAVFLNYLLDCLPASMLEFDGDSAKELHVRTCLARNVNLADFTDLTLGQLRQRVSSADPQARNDLAEIYGLLASEYAYLPVDLAKLAYSGFCIEYARTMSKRFLLSYGAIQCLERLRDLLSPQGFILMNDYGQTIATREEEFEHQRFSLATAVGVNFSLLRSYFEQPGKGIWIEPPSEAGGIHSRLLCRERNEETVLKFWECFSAPRHEYLNKPIEQARACAKVGRFEMAANYYHQALERQPQNWLLLSEISMFLIYSLHDLKAGIDMARSALALNPTCSADLWNTLGDGLYEFGRTEEAQSAYQKALAVNESDVRARFNLAFCHARKKDPAAALMMLAEAMALDKTGQQRRNLLDKQQEVLALLDQKHQQEYLLLINLVSRNAKKDEPTPPKAPD